MVDAGYRWAYWELERPGVVQRNTPVSVDAVRAAAGYWQPVREPSWLWLTDDVLPSVRSFLSTHALHSVTYGDVEEVVGIEPGALFDWLDVSRSPELTPRYFVETLRLESWAEVLGSVARAARKPWWWEEVGLMDEARTRFEKLATTAKP